MKNIAMYLRLSLSDADKGADGKDESNSIENQRLLIRNYLLVHPEIVGDVVEYKDDGFSGLNFNRPAFRQMIEDAKRGLVGTIIVKDLSRFGRDYIGMGDYLEQILPSLGTRLIAINSRYDSKEQGANIVSLDVSISNMINNMYSRDLSKKLRSSYAAKWKTGSNVGRSVPYGYTTDKNDPECKPIIDEDAAEVVRTIFMLAMEGFKTKEIAEELNAREIMTPMMYKNKAHGRKVNKTACAYDEQLWNTHMVASILHCYDYTGARTHGKIERIGIGLGKTREKGRHEWIVVENNHEPIVSKKVFNKVQKTIRSPGYRLKSHYKNPELLAGKVRCGCCGHLMQFIHGDKLYCEHASDVGSKSKCNRAHYDVRKIENTVLSSLKAHIDLMTKLSSSMKENSIIPNEQDTISDLKARVNQLNDEFVLQYENYVNGNLKRDGFIAIKEEITAKRAQLESQIKAIEEGIADQEKVMFDVNRVASIGKMIDNYNDITRKVLDVLVDDIRINNDGEVEIRYKFEDVYEEAKRDFDNCISTKI